MRDVGARLLARDQLGRETFRRVEPEGVRITGKPVWDCSLFDLLSAYGAIRARASHSVYAVKRRAVLALDEAIERLERLLGVSVDWTEIVRFLPETEDSEYRRSALASTFVAALELTRQGRADLSQTEAFGALMVRGKP